MKGRSSEQNRSVMVGSRNTRFAFGIFVNHFVLIIAIENARGVQEIAERTRRVERFSLEHLTNVMPNAECIYIIRPHNRFPSRYLKYDQI